MTCGMVLASGYGSRLRGYVDIPKYFVDIFGRPLIEYVLYSMCRSGVDDLYVVVNELTRRYLVSSGLIEKYGVDVIVNPRPELENGYTLLYSLSVVDDVSVLVSVADHIYPPSILRSLVDVDGDIVIAGDPDPLYIDIGEATKIRALGERVLEVGKGLDVFSHIDMGVFHIDRDKILSITRPLFDKFEGFTISEVINWVVAGGGEVLVKSFSGFPWRDIDVPRDIEYVFNDDFRIRVSRVFGWV